MQALNTTEYYWQSATSVTARLKPQTTCNSSLFRCSRSYPTATGKRISAATVFILSLIAAAT